MATRVRPTGGTRSRPPTTLPAPSGIRPRSALGKSNASHHSEAHADDAVPNTRPTATSDAEANIQVVVRCRRRSDKEIQESSPIVVTSAGAKSTDVTVQMEAQTSSFGIVQLPPTRTYPFDMVFGPEADQSMVYKDVVAPMLEEVIGGYNCTIFAYGQTGTGKTHTMQGDLKPTPLGKPSSSAGMIPRVLNSLFSHLNSKFNDYSVRVSYIELYNEELRDLLAEDFQAPSSSQPMGKGAPKEQPTTLQIYDDSSKKGVTIMGLRDITVKDAADAIALLIKGSERRQIASTKFNDHSSRSHTIFTLTVHTKELGIIGDDLLKVGKLNLVDLAGAENIGRSGAKEQRAAEAGNINKSLLTLGRVITLLVDKSQHIPYRESKLTRLLQDSLGGKTKTCIIATVSPARCNLEETISTLDYAIRAKSIKNRPEINQRMTKNMLLKDYVAEMDRLKTDLLAAREKNGIILSNEEFERLEIEKQTLVSDLADTKSQVAELQSKLCSTEAELETSIAVIAQRDASIAAMEDRLRETRLELDASERRLGQARNALEEEIIVREAHQGTEMHLDEVATGLKTVVEHGIRDIDALFGSLEQKAAILKANAKLAISSGSSISEQTRVVHSLMDTFVKTHDRVMTDLAASADKFQRKEIEALSALSSLVKQQLGALKEAGKALTAAEEDSSSAQTTLNESIQQASQALLQGFDAWSSGLLNANLTMLQDIRTAGKTSCAMAEGALDGLANIVEALARDALRQSASETQIFAEVKAMTEAAVDEEIRRIKEQNTLLKQMLETEQVESERTKNELVRRVSSMLEDYTRQRDTALRQAVVTIQDNAAITEKQWAAFASEQGAKLEVAIQGSQEASALVQRRRQDAKRKREDAGNAVLSIETTFKEGLQSMHDATSSTAITQRSAMQDSIAQAHVHQCEMFELMDRAKRARVDTSSSTMASVQQTYKSVREVAATSAKHISEEMNRVVRNKTATENELQSYQSNMATVISTIQQTGTSLESGTNMAEHTGNTPRKRAYTYTRAWNLTSDRDTLLESRRQGTAASSSSGQDQAV